MVILTAEVDVEITNEQTFANIGETVQVGALENVLAAMFTVTSPNAFLVKEETQLPDCVAIVGVALPVTVTLSARSFVPFE